MRSLFVPGILTNPLNGSHGHWRKHWRWARDWRDRTSMRILAVYGKRTEAYARQPKRVTFTLHVGSLWDSDALAAGVKPVRDALVDMNLIHGDQPGAGHVFHYEQIVQRARDRRGVDILVELLTGEDGA